MKNSFLRNSVIILTHFALLGQGFASEDSLIINDPDSVRERISINEGWTFTQGDPADLEIPLMYDLRPEVTDTNDDKDADSKPTEAVDVENNGTQVLKAWILPSGNDLIRNPSERHVRPEGHPGGDVSYVQGDFDDSDWEAVTLPHDWAIAGPFNEGWDEGVGGGMGRLPSPGIGWYRKSLDIPASDAGKSIFLDMDGAMSYAIVWLNGKLVGGWPYGYSSFRLDLTPYIVPGGENQLAIRLDNPPNSSRWYPGGGIYRNVWLVKTHAVHVDQWGTFVTTPKVSSYSATVDLSVTLDNEGSDAAIVELLTDIYALDLDGNVDGESVVTIDMHSQKVGAGEKLTATGSAEIKWPRLWGPIPNQKPNLYLAHTRVIADGKTIDSYETRFGIRDLVFDPDWGIRVNGEQVKIQGVNNHHDLGALGAAFNVRAAERQLEILIESGCNAVRVAHNPPAPELLDLCDQMGILVVNESFDGWQRKKTPLDFHLIFDDWSEQDMRALVRRDRNNPSVIMWSIGNEVGEQYTGFDGAAVGYRLRKISNQEDPTRPTTASMNWAKPPMAFPDPLELISMNYQGEGIRQDPMFDGVDRIRTPPMYPAFRDAYPNKVILSSETAACMSTRGTYLFPVTDKMSDIVRDGRGGDDENQLVSAYELGAVDFGSSADKVFQSLDQHPFSAGEFVWSGFDYIGEPTPYYGARSSYYGIVDLAGFPKDRFYLYQSRWRPHLPMAHILPHWSWPERVGEITPVHVFTSGDEAELFLNGRSLGRKVKQPKTYRFRWDDVVYEPGELKVVTYKNGREWAIDAKQTAGEPAGLVAQADRSTISADGVDLSFITVTVVDENGLTAPRADNNIQFTVEGPGEIVATDNGDPRSFVPFPSHEREAFSGLCLVIVRGVRNQPGIFTVKASSDGLERSIVEITTE